VFAGRTRIIYNLGINKFSVVSFQFNRRVHAMFAGDFLPGEDAGAKHTAHYFFTGICMMTSACNEMFFSVAVASSVRPRNQRSGGA